MIPQNSIRIPQNPTHTQQHNTTNKSDQIKTKNPYQNGTQGRLGHELYVYCPRWYSSLKKVAAGSTTKTSAVRPTPRLNASSSPKGSSVCLLNHEGILLHHSCRWHSSAGNATYVAAPACLPTVVRGDTSPTRTAPRSKVTCVSLKHFSTYCIDYEEAKSSVSLAIAAHTRCEV